MIRAWVDVPGWEVKNIRQVFNVPERITDKELVKILLEDMVDRRFNAADFSPKFMEYATSFLLELKGDN